MINATHDPAFGSILHPGIVPKFADTGPAGGIAWAGPELGSHNDEVYGKLIGLSETELDELRRMQVI
jgi:formyl-CoA transferase